MLILGVIIGLFVLVLLVVLHELGHAMVAKRNGVVVEEFGIGFSSRAKKWQPKKSFLGKNVIFSLNWLPLGGLPRGALPRPDGSPAALAAPGLGSSA